MNPIAAVTSALRNYANFRGRAQRSEFWWFFLFAWIFGYLTLFLVILPYLSLEIAWIWILYVLGLIMPTWAVTVRRLHDTNRSAAWFVVPLVVHFSGLTIAVLFAVGIATTFEMFSYGGQSDRITEVIQKLDAVGVWWIFAAFIFWMIWTLAVMATTVMQLILLALPGTPGPNRYGPDPSHPELDSA